MSRESLDQHAEELARLLPQVMRALFTLDESDAGMELPVAQLRVCALLPNRTRLVASGDRPHRTSPALAAAMTNACSPKSTSATREG